VEKNWSSHANACFLADKLQDYWRKRGFSGVKFWVEQRNTALRKEYIPQFDVRSNLVNGLPLE